MHMVTVQYLLRECLRNLIIYGDLLQLQPRRHYSFEEPGSQDVLILGLVFEEYYKELAENDVRMAVCDYETARKFNKAAEEAGKKGLIHLAADTGMTRIGFKDSEESLEEIRRIAALPNVEIEGLFTHFARADEYDRTPAMVQLKRYLDFADLLEKNGIHIPRIIVPIVPE